jgi:excisionase family DNA binding protein
MNDAKPDIQAYKINDFCKAYSIGRSTAYEEIGAGRLKTTRIGRSVLISKKAAQDWLQSYEQKSKKARGT